MLIYARIPGAKWWSRITMLSAALILVSSAVYFQTGATPRFLLEKGDVARNPWWLATFYFHVVTASLCLLVGAPLLYPNWTRRHPVWHRGLGYVYVNIVLWIAAPTGLALATTAKGGLAGSAGFILAGVFWWASTWSGYRAIRRGDLAAHIHNMIRSYAWALSAPIFRILQLALYFGGIADGPNYLSSLWLSLAVSVWLAESFPQRSRGRAVTTLPPLGAFP
jgi:hypothetical protein